MSSLKFSAAQDIDLAWVDGQLVMEDRGEKFEKTEADIQKDIVPVLEQMPVELVSLQIVYRFVFNVFMFLVRRCSKVLVFPIAYLVEFLENSDKLLWLFVQQG